MHEHGNFSLEVKGDLLYVTLDGPFNYGGIAELVAEVKKIINSFGDNEFAIITNGLTFEGGTPDAFELSNEFEEWLFTQNCYARAFVFPDILNKIVDENIPINKKKQSLKYFTDLAEAEAWMQDVKESRRSTV